MNLRLTYLIGFILITGILGASLYLQDSGVTPCPLCLMQRFAMTLLGVCFFLGTALTLKKCGRFFIAILSFLFASLGILFSARQVVLQHISTGLVGNCDVSLKYLIKALPLTEVLKRIYEGGTECSQVTWRFLNLSLAEWSLACFIFFILLIVYQFIQIIKADKP